MSSEEAKKKKPVTTEAAKKPAAEEAAKKPVTTGAPKKPAAEEAAKKKKKKAVRISSYYKIVDGSTLQRKLRSCPRCGPGNFLAEHYDRISCGKCGYAEFRRKSASP
jgi:small subunit ribosomal protein S27Ae